MPEATAPGDCTDRQITETFARDPQAAFRLLMNRYSRRLYLYIRRMVLDHDDTDDILQNTLIKAWEKMDRLRESAALSSWLYRIATNETMTFLSEKTKRGHVSLNGTDIADTEAEYTDDRLSAITLSAIQTLPKVQQAVFTMRHFEELKFREIGEIFGTTEGSVKASYHIALGKVQSYVKEHYLPE